MVEELRAESGIMFRFLTWTAFTRLGNSDDGCF